MAARCRSRLSSLALRSVRSALLPAANRSLSLAPLVARFARTALLGCGPVFIPGAIAVIPARAGSRRLPEKPLVSIGGVPLVVRVLDRVRAAGLFERVVVATDDERIAGRVEAASGEVVMVTEPMSSPSTGEWLCRLRALPLRCSWPVQVPGFLALRPSLRRKSFCMEING